MKIKRNWTIGENKPNSNPIKPNLKRAKMNANSLITKDYERNDIFAVRKNKPNSNPISIKPKMNVSLYIIEDYENETAFRLEQNKPKQTQFQMPISAPKEWQENMETISCLTVAVPDDRHWDRWIVELRIILEPHGQKLAKEKENLDEDKPS